MVAIAVFLSTDQIFQWLFWWINYRLAASIAVEEDENLTKSASTSAAAIPFEEGSGDEEEEMILVSSCIWRIIFLIS